MIDTHTQTHTHTHTLLSLSLFVLSLFRHLAGVKHGCEVTLVLGGLLFDLHGGSLGETQERRYRLER